MPKDQAIALRKRKKALAEKEKALAERQAELDQREQAVKKKEADVAAGAEKAGKLIESATDVVGKLWGLEGEMDEKQRAQLNLETARGRRVRDTAARLGAEWKDRQDGGTGPRGPGE